MKVTFAHYGDELASSRLRAKIPQRELAKLGIEQGKDVLIYGKHFLSERVIWQFGHRIFDICDDHFDHPKLGDYYRLHANKANRITCNSLVMQQRIREATGRDALVIPEPYESEEQEPAIAPELLWFGHSSNYAQIERIKPFLEYPLTMLSNHEKCTPWSPKSFKANIEKPCIVVIPTGHKKAKSENRMVEAIRCGRYVCAEHLPSYEPFDRFFPLGDIPAHIEVVLQNPDDAIYRIHAAQEYIRELYSPSTIAKHWLALLKGMLDVNHDLCGIADSRHELVAS